MPPRSGQGSVWRSLGHAVTGLGDLLGSQRNARIHLGATLLVLGIGLYAGIGLHDWALLVVVTGWVWCLEAVNTALERLADAVTTEHHPLIGRAKDLAAGAVLLAALLAVIVGGLILLPPLWQRWTG